MSGKHRTIAKLPSNRPPLTDEDGEVREIAAEDFKHFRPMREVFPEVVEAFERSRGQRGRQRAPTKERISLRLDRDVLESYRAGGPGWQTRINDDLARLQKRKRHG